MMYQMDLLSAHGHCILMYLCEARWIIPSVTVMPDEQIHGVSPTVM